MAEYIRGTARSTASINDELEKIQNSLTDKLDRTPDGGQANQMEDSLDMNSKRIYNLPDPVTEHDAPTKGYVDTLVGNMVSADITVIGDVTVHPYISLAKSDLSLQVGDTVETLGYYVSNDGGGARYVVVAGGTGTDDGGSYHDLDNGLQLSLLDGGSIDIRQFGIITDGSIGVQGTLQTSQFQTFIDYCTLNYIKATISSDGVNNPCYIDVDDTVIIPNRGLQLVGHNMRQVVIRNLSNNLPILQIGDKGVALQHAQFSDLQNFMVEGNASTAEGIALLGGDDDGLSDASKVCSLDRIRIFNILAGDALRVSSWNNNFGLIEIENAKNGLRIGSEANACNFDVLRITGCSEHGLYTNFTNTARTSAVNFNSLTVQQCGDATHPAILLDKGRGYNIDALYLEDNHGDTVVLIDNVPAVNISSWTYAHAGVATQDMFVIDNNATVFLGQGAVFGTVNSHVRVEGSSTKAIIQPVVQQTGSVTTSSIIDNSVSKQVIVFHDGSLGVKANRLVVNQSSTSNGAVLVQTNGTEHFKITAGGFLEWSDTGHSIENGSQWFDLKRNGNYAETRANIFTNTDGTDSVKWRFGSGTPEGAVSAPIGSIFSRVDGGAGTSFYVKESGTGTTGWVAK